MSAAATIAKVKGLVKNFEAPRQPGQMRLGTKIIITVDNSPRTFTAANRNGRFGFIDDVDKSFTELDKALPALRIEAGGLYRFDDAGQSALARQARDDIANNKQLSVQERVQQWNQLDDAAKKIQAQRMNSQAGKQAQRLNNAKVAVDNANVTPIAGTKVTPVVGGPTPISSSVSTAIDSPPVTLTQSGAKIMGEQVADIAVAAARQTAGAIPRGRNALRRNAIIERPPNKPPPTPSEARTVTNDALAASAATAHTKGTISKRVFDILRNNKGKVALATVLIGSGLLNVVQGKTIDDLEDELTDVQLAQAANEHMKDLNGCYLIDRSNNYSKTKVKLLTCGHYDVAGALETCTTQSYSAGKTLTECPATTFNPCAKGSTNRAGTGPLVPDACSTYLYKGTAPPAVAGVTVKDACKTTDGKALDEKQACSVYCKTENFELPPMVDLLCVDADYKTVFADLMAQLGIPPEELYPPASPPPPAASSFSKPLLITTGVTAGLFLILAVVYFLKRKRF